MVLFFFLSWHRVRLSILVVLISQREVSSARVQVWLAWMKQMVLMILSLICHQVMSL